MKKVLTVGLLFVSLFLVTGCGNTESLIDHEDWSMPQNKVEKAVDGWMVYTNPAYRYEVRIPQDWTYSDSGEDGYTSSFTAPGKDKHSISIKSYSNWQDKLSIERFYQAQEVDLVKDYSEQRIQIGEYSGLLFKKVDLRDTEDLTRTTDIISLDLKDRIIEFEVWDDMETAKIIMNNIKFYPAR